MERLRSHLTYANDMAATGRNVKNGSSTGADIKTTSVTGRDVKSLGAGDFKKGTLRAGATGRTGPQGPTGAPGAAGSALGCGRVAGNGALTLSKTVTVTVGSGAAGGAYPLVDDGGSAACPAGTQVSVNTRLANGPLSAQPFYFTIN